MARGKRSIQKEANKLKIFIVIIVVIAILSFFFYKVIGHPPNKSLDGYSIYEAANYTICYKSDWTSAIADDNPNMIVFSSTDNLGIINVITEDLTTKYTLDEYVDASIYNIKSILNLTDGDIGKEKVSINGVKAYRISYIASEITRIVQTIFLSDSTAYIVSFNSAIDYFDVYYNMEKTLVMK